MRWTHLIGLFAFAAAAVFLVGSANAQQKTVEERATGPHQVQVELVHSTVLVVEGNHLVTRLENGRVEAILVPEDFRFHLDGQALSVHELKPGMILTETITTTTKPTMVRTVEITNGTVWHSGGNTLIIRDRFNKMHRYHVPDWATIEVSGETMNLNQLRHGQNVTATIVTEEPVTYAERESRTTVRHPAKPPMAAAVEKAPVKSTMEEQPAEEQQAEEQPAEEPQQEELPKTASPLPLAGGLGALLLVVSLGLKTVRKSA
jgi:hypothetical protein